MDKFVLDLTPKHAREKAVWKTPKTNWVAGDYFNYTDWERIIGNLEYLRDVYFVPGTWYSMEVPETVNGYPTVILLNNFEQNLEKVRINITNNASVSKLVTWYGRLDTRYVRNPDYKDYNRWETLEVTLFNITKHVLVSGTFRAGNNRTVQHFSRGRDFLSVGRGRRR